MSNDLNQWCGIGRLGKDSEQRFMPNGDELASFSLAVGWKGKDSEGVEWVNVVAFGKLASICNKYLQKGSQVYIQGRLKTKNYINKAGVERYSTEIVADKMQMLGGKSEAKLSAPVNEDADEDWVPF